MLPKAIMPALLELENLSLSLPDLNRRPVLGPPPPVDILKDVSLTLEAGDALGIVGESGSGKTSLARSIMRLHEPTGGRLRFDGHDITHLSEERLRGLRPRFQMVFQDPQSSLNPRRRVGDIVAQPLLTYGRVDNRRQARERAADLLAQVTLDPALADRYPHELSGGQRQRVGIARAISLEPALLVADEIVSGLDVSSQAQILALLRRLRHELGLALVFISHDLSVVRAVCDRVAVMLRGEIVESGPCADIFATQNHAYTRRLIAAIPLPEVDPQWIDAADIDDTDRETEKEPPAMQIEGATVLVTGANRGIGAAFVNALKARGAGKIYAAARDAGSLAGIDGVEAIALDITDPAAVAAAAERCADVTLLINNAGVNFNTPLIGHASMDNARAEMETNYFGTMAMCRAFAPVLKANGGGAIVNILSILARVNMPLVGSLCASKAAALSMTQGVRAELAGQGTAVIAVMPGAVDTRMTEGLQIPKMAPAEVASAALDAVEAGTEEVYPGDMATAVSQGLAADPKAVEKEFAGYLPQ